MVLLTQNLTFATSKKISGAPEKLRKNSKDILKPEKDSEKELEKF